jgi:hypothetical protein
MSAPTNEEISVALDALAWLKVNHRKKIPKKELRLLLEAAVAAETLGLRFLLGRADADGDTVIAAIEKASLPLYENQKRPHARPRRNKILTGDK